FLAGFAAGCEAPWASVAAWQEVVGSFLDLGFDEFVFPEPALEDWPVFESVVSRVIPDLRSSRTLSHLPTLPGFGPALYEIIAGRYERRPTLLTSTKSLTRW